MPRTTARDTDLVEISTAASPERLSSIRAVAANLAMHEDFDLDAVADLRLAVDEACSMLVGIAAPDAKLHCSFAVERDGIRVSTRVSTDGTATIERGGFAWQVLATLTESADAHTDADSAVIEMFARKPTQ